MPLQLVEDIVGLLDGVAHAARAARGDGGIERVGCGAAEIKGGEARRHNALRCGRHGGGAKGQSRGQASKFPRSRHRCLS